jgi:hypothetical protein
VTLSATDAELGAGTLLTLNLTEFNLDSFYPWTYTCVSAPSVGLRMYNFTPENFYIAEVTYFGDPMYRGAEGRKGVPVKMSGAANGWGSSGIDPDPVGQNVNALYIQPVYAVLTPWEYRRRRLLEYV